MKMLTLLLGTTIQLYDFALNVPKIEFVSILIDDSLVAALDPAIRLQAVMTSLVITVSTKVFKIQRIRLTIFPRLAEQSEDP